MYLYTGQMSLNNRTMLSNLKHISNVHAYENECKYICIKCRDIHLILTQNMVIPLIHLQVCFFLFDVLWK